MPIADELSSVIRKAAASKLLPCKLPFVYASDLAAGDNTVFSIAGPTLSPDSAIIVDGISATRDTDVLLKIACDKYACNEEAGAYTGIGKIDSFYHLATRSFSFVLNADDIVENYTLFAGIWCLRPTVAQRLKWGIALTNSEKELARQRGIEDSVAKGILPFPLWYQIDREFIGFTETRGYILAALTAGTTTLVDRIKAERDEVIVLEGISATPNILANDVEIWISRDDDESWLKLPAFAMSLDYTIPCHIPAIDKLKIAVYTTGVGITDYEVRLNVGHYYLTDLLRARFSLEGASKEAIDSTTAGAVP